MILYERDMTFYDYEFDRGYYAFHEGASFSAEASTEWQEGWKCAEFEFLTYRETLE